MRHEYTLSDYGLTLRPVVESDAEFIMRLRTRPGLSRYIGDTGDLAAQRAWMEQYFDREGDYYFIAAQSRDLAPVGTIAIYNVEAGKRAEWGRWVALPGGQFGTKSLALIYRLAFDCMGFESLYSRTVAENHRLVRFHDNCGLMRTGVQHNAVTIRGKSHDLVVHEIDRRQWPAVKIKLETRMNINATASLEVVW